MEQPRERVRHNKTERERTNQYEKERDMTRKNRTKCQGTRQDEKESEQQLEDKDCEDMRKNETKRKKN